MNPNATLMLAPASAAPEQTRTPFMVAAMRLTGFCLVILTLIASGFTLYAAREFLIPIAIAFLLAVLLSPVARVMERRLSTTLSAAIITLGVVGLLAGIIALLLPELAILSEQAPRSMHTLEQKIAGLRSALSGLERASEEIQQATQQVGVAPATDPVVVQQASPLTIALTSVAQIAAQLAATMLLTFFLLSQRRRMKVIVIAMADNHSTRKRLITMFNDIKSRISTYLLAITLTAIGLGLVSAVALYIIGFPNPWLWGAAVTIANFVPYAGPAAVQLFALLVGALTYSSFGEAVMPAAVLWILNFIEGQVVTPMFVAKRVVLNPLSVFLAIVFGGWIWGIVGAIVAVPALIIGASIIQHWWAPCSTENKRPLLSSAWRAWSFESQLPQFRLRRRTGISVHSSDIDIV